MGLVKATVLFLASSSTNDAFTTSPPFPTTRPAAAAPTALASALENASEVPEQSLFSSNDEMQVPSSASEFAPSESPIAASVTAMPPTDSIQSRSIFSNTIDRDAIINSAIFVFAVGLVLERILSVDVGITRGWSPAEIAERIPLDNWRSYTNILNMAPLQTKAVTSATVYTIGDIIAQRRDGTEVGELDRGRIARSLLAGLIGHGPLSHVWYHVSEDFFDNVLNLHAWWDFVPKVVVDQTVFGPIWNNSYILLLGLMQLQGPKQIWSDMKRTTIPLVISGLKLWPFVHCITYGLIPVENRLLWVDAVEIVWVTILASEASSSGEEEGGSLVIDADRDDVSLR